ncbi:MAG: (2Fe-2S)-binding protein [Deltaproteobacteria bacterium]|nr:(2Fe-2S)-binding protein [Deltaproteobacteria bacterium]
MQITINDKKLECEKGQTIIQVADQNDIKIPRFCYHPNLEVVAQCRMCLVEVEGVRKPLAACSTPLTDGMVVKTASPLAKEAQESVLEFLLINHPLDCPICDKGGECPLQNNAFGYGRVESHMLDTKRRLEKNKDFGQHIVFDTERCILCSRCERFCKEITGTAEIGIVHRGSKSEIAVFDEKGVDNDFSLNVVDLCPVGALTNKDFRFKARPWEMKATKSFCPSCQLGCSSQFWVKTSFKDQKMLRMNSPGDADNWLCDYGRGNYKVFNNQDVHLKEPQIRVRGQLVKASWQDALQRAHELLSGVDVQFMFSGNLTSEALDEVLPLIASCHPEANQKESHPLIKSWKYLKEKDLLLSLRGSHGVPWQSISFKKLIQVEQTVQKYLPVFYLDLRKAGVSFEEVGSLKDVELGEGVAVSIPESILGTEEGFESVKKIKSPSSVIPLFSASNTIALLERGLIPWQVFYCHPERGPSLSLWVNSGSIFPSLVNRIVYFTGRTLKQNFDYAPLKKAFEGSKLILQDTIESPLCDIAEVVLPMQDLAESGGHYRTYYSFWKGTDEARFEKCMNPVGDSLPDWKIFQSLQHSLYSKAENS